MDPQQQQTGAEAQPQPQAQAPDANGAPQFDPNFLAQASNPDAMGGILTGQGFIPDPNIADLSMTGPSMLLPMMFANGQAPPPQTQAKPISAGNDAPRSRALQRFHQN